ncbi:hypothetical protein TrLO_g2686 [Triparma laevis f. longispina]|uniref:Uncharacterized protein n=1 Tax=Triparma laevis f. longispina TaxID=1714387 RepID=A0A9W6Z9P4_9STRA|nr:hypothetical protein TrLO_g2686 [Triparma laevis f. longispina]
MPPRARKKRKGNEEGGGDDDVFSYEVKVETLVAVKQEREQEGNPQENNVEEIQQAEESSTLMLLIEMRSMREEMKGMKRLQEKTSEELKGVREESLNGKLSEARKKIAALKQRYKFRSYQELMAAARLWC